MSNRLKRAAMCGLLLLVAGCANVHLPRTITDGDLTPLRKRRNAEFKQQFQQQRDLAEFEAAKAKWVQEHDAAGCRELLEKLLARNPQHQEAARLLAELPTIPENNAAAVDDLGAVAGSASVSDENGGVLPAGHTQPTGNDAGSATMHGSANYAGSADYTQAAEHLDNGREALAEGRLDEAMDCFRLAAAAQPDNPRLPIAAGAALLRANRPDLAIELLMPAAKQIPNSATVHRMLGVAYYRTGDYKSSQVALQQALSLDKSSALSYLLMGCVSEKLGRHESAEAYFRQARSLDPRYNALR